VARRVRGLELGHLIAGQVDVERGHGVVDVRRPGRADERGDDDRVVPEPRQRDLRRQALAALNRARGA
jgi:hypothetical protein